MQYRTFKNILAIYKPEVRTFIHGHTMYGDGRTCITINNKDYYYSGSYSYILAKLGVAVITQKDINEAEETLNDYKKSHGSTTDIIAKLLKKPRDCSSQIAYWQGVLETYSKMPLLDEKKRTLTDNGKVYKI